METLKLNKKKDANPRFDEIMMTCGDWHGYDSPPPSVFVVKKLNYNAPLYEYFIAEDVYGEHYLYRSRKC